MIILIILTTHLLYDSALLSIIVRILVTIVTIISGVVLDKRLDTGRVVICADIRLVLLHSTCW